MCPVVWNKKHLHLSTFLLPVNNPLSLDPSTHPPPYTCYVLLVSLNGNVCVCAFVLQFPMEVDSEWEKVTEKPSMQYQAAAPLKPGDNSR